MSAFEEGFFVGLLVGEAHFGGDGGRPQITLRMGTRHEVVAKRLKESFPGGKLYGPYSHDGREYWQWMARGRFLDESFLPWLLERLGPELDRHTWERLTVMLRKYYDPENRTREGARRYRRVVQAKIEAARESQQAQGAAPTR